MLEVKQVKHYRVNPMDVVQYSYVLFASGISPKSLLKGIPDENILSEYSKKLKQYEPHTKGGKTVVIVVDEDGNEYKGVSYCSMVDAFNYSKGRKLATKRAVESAFKHLWS